MIPRAHGFQKGIDLDSAKENVGNDRFTDANDADLVSDDPNEIGWAKPYNSTTLEYTIPSADAQSQVIRLQYIGANTYNIKFYDEDGNLLFFIYYGNTNFTDLSSVIVSTAAANGYTATIGAIQTDDQGASFYTITLTLGSAPIVFKTYYAIGSAGSAVVYPAFIIRDAILEATELKPIASYNLNEIQIVFSYGVTSTCDEIGVAQRINGTMVYTRLLRTNQYGFSPDNVFTIRLEIQSNMYYGIYWTDTVHKDKVLYFPVAYSQDCVLKWTPSSYGDASTGIKYTFSSLDQISDLQLLNSLIRCEYSNQIQSGGNLMSGGWRYAVRSGIYGTQNITEWSYLSQLIPVFKTSIDSQAAYQNIQGDISGQITNKINVLTVRGAESEKFDYVELAAVHYNGAVASAYIIGKFDAATNSFDVRHTGFESSIQAYDVNLLIPVSEVILSSNDLEIKKNRLNLAGNMVAIDDPALQALTDEIELSAERVELDTVGKLSTPDSSSIFKVTQSTGQELSPTLNQTLLFNTVESDPSGSYNNPSPGIFTVLGAYNKLRIDLNLVLYALGEPGLVPDTAYVIGLERNGSIVVQSPVIHTQDSGSTWTSLTLWQTNIFECSINDEFRIVYNWQQSSSATVLGAGSSLAVNYIGVGGQDFSTTRPGEYQLPVNIATRLGYMFNETYAFFARYHMDNGYITSGYPIGTLVFNPSFPQNLYTDNDNLNDMTMYAYYALVSNIPITALKALGVKGVSIWRAECNTTVLGSGVFLTADQMLNSTFYGGYYPGIPTTNGDNSGITPGENLGFFISADTRIAQTQYSSGSQLWIYGSPTLEGNGQINGIGVVSKEKGIIANGSYAQYKGYTNLGGFDTYTIEDSQYVKFNTWEGYNSFSSPEYKPSTQNSQTNQYSSAAEAIAMQLDSNVLVPFGSAPFNGLLMAQLTRSLSNQYDMKNVKIVPTGAFYEFDTESPETGSISVFGGDTYTQKSFVRLLYGVQNRVTTTELQYSFISYYAQNRVNTQLFYTDEAQPKETWNLGAAGSIYAYLFPPLVDDNNPEEQFNYDKSYIEPNLINAQNAYNDKLIQIRSLGSRIWYSKERPNGSVYDYLREIPPLNFKDLDAKDGDILALNDVNDVMIAWQQSAVSVLPYQSDVALSATNGADVYLGNGAVYAQRESIISTFGTNLKSNVLIAKNENGNDTAYWIAEFYKKLMGYRKDDGGRCISDQQLFRSFFLNRTAFINQEWDITMGYLERKGIVFITARAYNRNIEEWDSTATYNSGDVVSYSIVGSQNIFSQLPNLYMANTTTTPGGAPFENAQWDFIPITDTDYYNYWTFAYNEKMDAGTGTATFLPDRYFPYMNGLLAPRPKSSWGNVYSLLTGSDVLKYFQEGDEEDQGYFQIEVTSNMQSPLNTPYTLRAVATKMNVGEDNVAHPQILEVYTSTQSAIMNGSDMELRFGNLCCAIQDDEDGNAITSQWISYKISNHLNMKIKGVVNTFYVKSRMVIK